MKPRGLQSPGFFLARTISNCYHRAMPDLLNRIDSAIASWMDRHGLFLLRISLAVVFIWFGVLKPFRISPADDLIQRTVYWFDPDVFIPILGIWEAMIGVCLLVRPLIRVALLLLFLQMPGTFLPLVLLPNVCF